MQESTTLLKRLLQEVQTMNIRQLKQYFEELMAFPHDQEIEKLFVVEYAIDFKSEV